MQKKTPWTFRFPPEAEKAILNKIQSPQEILTNAKTEMGVCSIVF